MVRRGPGPPARTAGSIASGEAARGGEGTGALLIQSAGPGSDLPTNRCRTASSQRPLSGRTTAMSGVVGGNGDRNDDTEDHLTTGQESLRGFRSVKSRTVGRRETLS